MTIKELKLFLGWCDVEEILIAEPADYNDDDSEPIEVKKYFKGNKRSAFEDFLKDETIDSLVIDDVYAVNFGVINGRTRLSIWLP